MFKFNHFMSKMMYGRYGVDQASRFLSGIAFAFMLISIIFGNRFFLMAAVLCIVFAYYRIFSRNLTKRYNENQKYLNIKYEFVKRISYFKNYLKDIKVNKIFKCPNCGQKIRIPRHKGNVMIRCPKCRIGFHGRT